MKNILVIFGGCSSEYGVSLQSAAGVLNAMDREKYNPVMLGITKEGAWYHYSGSVEDISANRWLQTGPCIPLMLSPRREGRRLILRRGERLEGIEIDAAFPVLHGKNGEDGTVQGMLELLDIPVVGCGILSSALCMDKDRAHKLAALAGAAVPRSVLLEGKFGRETAQKAARDMGYPLFVKPVKAGSSYGVSRVERESELDKALSLAFAHDRRVLMEQAIPGRELGCAVMGNGELICGEPDEIELSGGFFDFREKYDLISARIHVPARIAPEKAEEVKDLAKRIYRALDCRGFARVDMFLQPDGQLVFNEVNTIPGFTEHSRFPGMMRAAGMDLRQVIDRAIELAVEP